jgi:Skp family chaperone for outer membrane proteins
MKTFRSIAAVFVFAAIFAVGSAFAQTTPAPTGKIAIVNTMAFGDKAGINRYITAMTSLETELKPDITALQTMGNRIQALETELQNYEKQLAEQNPKVPFDRAKVQATAQTKLQEYQDLGRQYKFKEDDYKIKLQRREEAVVRPVSRDIGNALQEFAKKNGYLMIFDVSKDDKGMLLVLDEKSDVTKEFIAFYNARPATTAVK